MKLLIATHNSGKFAEIVEALTPLPFTFLSLADLGVEDGVEETGATHQENAILKARYFFEKTRLPTLGEDSGISVDAFPGELGVATRRWKGLGKAADAEWIGHFLKAMEEVPDEKRAAKFSCFAALILGEKDALRPRIFWGETRGRITRRLEAPLKPGIPISSCFQPEGFDSVYAALTPAQKNQVSHRGKAMKAAREFLDKVKNQKAKARSLSHKVNS